MAPSTFAMGTRGARLCCAGVVRPYGWSDRRAQETSAVSRYVRVSICCSPRRLEGIRSERGQLGTRAFTCLAPHPDPSVAVYCLHDERPGGGLHPSGQYCPVDRQQPGLSAPVRVLPLKGTRRPPGRWSRRPSGEGGVNTPVWESVALRMGGSDPCDEGEPAVDAVHSHDPAPVRANGPRWEVDSCGGGRFDDTEAQ